MKYLRTGLLMALAIVGAVSAKKQVSTTATDRSLIPALKAIAQYS
jgi:hypothetical protein